MSGGQPWSPYARSAGQTSRLLPPTLTSWRASVQHLITPFSGTVADSPRCMELSKTVPSVSRPSYLPVTVSVALGVAPVPGVIGIMIRPEAVLSLPAHGPPGHQGFRDDGRESKDSLLVQGGTRRRELKLMRSRRSSPPRRGRY